MNKLIFGLVIFIFAANSHAESKTEYLVARTGAMFIQAQNTQPLLAGGVYYGYGIDENVALEVEANIGAVGGSYNDGQGNYGEFDVWTIAGYAVYRYPISNQVFAKGKFGLLFENITNNTRTDKLIKNDYGFSGGLGLGLHLKKKLTIELEASLLEKDIYYAGSGFHYRF